MPWKYIKVMIVLIPAVVGLVLISLYTATEADADKPDPGKRGVVNVIDYETTVRTYSGAYLEHIFYPLYFEYDHDQQVTFVFRNITDKPVTMVPVSRSCSACTHASFALLPDSHPYYKSDYDNIGAMVGGPPMYLAYRWKEERLAALPADTWKHTDFLKVTPFTIPAGTPLMPTYAALRLNIRIAPGRKDDLAVVMKFSNADSIVPMEVKFLVQTIGVPPFDVYPKDLNFGEFAAGDDQRVFEIFYYSSVLSDSELGLPRWDTVYRRFISAGDPVKLSEPECEELARRLAADKFLGYPKVAYRIPFRLHRKEADGPRELDLGPIDTSIDFTAASGPAANRSDKIRLRANVRGAIAVEGNRNTIELGDFRNATGVTKPVFLTGERTDLDLEVVREEFHPRYLLAEIQRDSAVTDRSRWRLIVRIEPGQGLGPLPQESVVVLKERKTGQMIRIPVRGHGRS